MNSTESTTIDRVQFFQTCQELGYSVDAAILAADSLCDAWDEQQSEQND